MTTPLIINNEFMYEAHDAVREIVMLYVGLAEEGRFMHNIDAEGRFDCLRFVDAEADPKAYWCDMELLRTGSAIAFLCILVTRWEEMDGPGQLYLPPEYRGAVEQGRLHHTPDVEALIRSVLERDEVDRDEPWLREGLDAVLRTHVRGFFRRLADG